MVQFHPKQRDLVGGQCLTCAPYKKCTRCHDDKQQSDFQPRQWHHEHICDACLTRNLSTKQCTGACGAMLPEAAIHHRMWAHGGKCKQCARPRNAILKLCTGTCGGGELPEEAFTPSQWEYRGSARRCKKCAPPRNASLKLCTGTCGGGELPEGAFTPSQWEYGGSVRRCKNGAPARLRKGQLRCGAAHCGAVEDEREFNLCLDATPSKRGKKSLRCNDCVARQEQLRDMHTGGGDKATQVLRLPGPFNCSR